MYTIKRDGAYHIVVTVSGGMVQFRSLRRTACLEWIADNA